MFVSQENLPISATNFDSVVTQCVLHSVLLVHVKVTQLTVLAYLMSHCFYGKFKACL